MAASCTGNTWVRRPTIRRRPLFRKSEWWRASTAPPAANGTCSSGRIWRTSREVLGDRPQQMVGANGFDEANCTECLHTVLDIGCGGQEYDREERDRRVSPD